MAVRKSAGRSCITKASTDNRFRSFEYQMSTNPLYFPLKVELDYSYSLGDLKPYFDALQEGRALASECPECREVKFPPRLQCDKDGKMAGWKELTGLGTVKRITAGRNETLALIAMDGADNLCLGRLVGKDLVVGDRVRLERIDATDIQHPAQCAVFRHID